MFNSVLYFLSSMLWVFYSLIFKKKIISTSGILCKPFSLTQLGFNQTMRTTIKVQTSSIYFIHKTKPMTRRMIFFSLFSLELYKSLFLKIQDKICLFCHILFCSRYTVKNPVKVIKSKVDLTVEVLLSGYIGLDLQWLLLCSCVKRSSLTRL